MESDLRPSVLAAQAGISLSYASEVLSGARNPSRPLAIHIFRRTGWKHDSIVGLSAEQITLLETIEPWKSPVSQVEA